MVTSANFAIQAYNVTPAMVAAQVLENRVGQLTVYIIYALIGVPGPQYACCLFEI